MQVTFRHLLPSAKDFSFASTGKSAWTYLKFIRVEIVLHSYNDTCVKNHLYHKATKLSELCLGHVAEDIALIFHHRSDK